MVKSLLLGVVAFLLAYTDASDSATDTKYCLHNALAEGKSNAFAFCSVSTQIDMLSAQVMSLVTQVNTLGTDVSTLGTQVNTLGTDASALGSQVSTLEVQNEISKNGQAQSSALVSSLEVQVENIKTEQAQSLALVSLLEVQVENLKKEQAESVALVRLDPAHGNESFLYNTEQPKTAYDDLVDATVSYLAERDYEGGESAEFTAVLPEPVNSRSLVVNDRTLSGAFAAAKQLDILLTLEVSFVTTAPTLSPTLTDIASNDDLAWIKEQLPQGKTIGTRLFKAAIDGDAASDFHLACDGKGETLVLVETTKGYRLGVFVGKPWSSNSGYRAYTAGESRPFVFGLPGGGRSIRERLDLKAGSEGSVYYHSSDWGPSFYDLWIYNDCLSKTDNYFSPHKFESPAAGRWVLTGGTTFENSKFQVADYEVFHITMDAL